MKSKFLFFISSVFFLFLFSNFFHAVDYPTGGDGTLEVITTYKRLDGGDTIGTTNLGLVWFKEGFYVAEDIDNGISVDIATPLPIGGQLNLETSFGGLATLYLESDLTFVGNTKLSESGSVEFNGHYLSFIGPFDLNGRTITTTWWEFRNNNRSGGIDGNGNVIDFGSTSGFIINHSDYTDEAKRNYDFFVRNCFLGNMLEPDPFVFTDTNSRLNLENVVINLAGDVYLGGCESLQISGDVLVTGIDHSLCIDTQCKILDGGRLIFDIGTTLSVGYKADFDLSGEGVLCLNGCNVKIGGNVGWNGDDPDTMNGLEFTDGTVIFENKVVIDDDSNNKAFQIKDSAKGIVLSGAQIVLEGTTTFSVV